MTPDIAVIIPTLNEAAAMPRLLAQLQAQRGVTLEIIVCDGGSDDDTCDIARAAGARVMRTSRGRATQMNAGAAQANAAHLLFLHADSRLDAPTLLADALASLIACEAERVIAAGHFALQFFDYPPQAERFYRHVEGKTALGRRYSINGDQGVLISAQSFNALGGFDARLPFLEDQRFAETLRQHGRWLLLPGRLGTSARRFEIEGRGQRYALMALIMAMWIADVDEFFEQAPKVYTSQDQAAALQMAPYLKLIRDILWRRRWLGTIKTLYRIGGFVRENTWQLFYWRDLRNGDASRLPRLAFYDRWIAAALANPVGNFLAALLACAWFYVWLPLQSMRRH